MWLRRVPLKKQCSLEIQGPSRADGQGAGGFPGPDKAVGGGADQRPGQDQGPGQGSRQRGSGSPRSEAGHNHAEGKSGAVGSGKRRLIGEWLFF